MVRWSIFSVHTLPTGTYQSCKWEGMDMHSLATLVGQTWVKHRWNQVIAGQNVLFWRGSINRLDLQINYRYRAETFRIYSYRIEIHSCVDTRSDLMRIIHNGTSNLNILEILNISDLHWRPASREPIWLDAPNLLWVLYACVPTHPGNGKARTCIV